MRHCPNCGEPLNDSDRICKNCGVFLGNYLETRERKEYIEPIEKEEHVEEEKKKEKIHWKIPLLFLLLGIVIFLIKLVLKKLDLASNTISSILNIIALGSCFLTIPATIIVIIIYKRRKKKDNEFTSSSTERKQKIKKENKKDNEIMHILQSNISRIEQRRMVYVGKNYVKISTKKFSLPALIFNLFYLLYRKRYLLAISGMSLMALLTLLSRYFPIVRIITGIIAIVISLVLAFTFNQYYIKVVNKKLQKLQKKSQELNSEEFLKLCQRKGGTNIILTILIGLLFTVAIFYINIMKLPPLPAKKEPEKPQVDTVYKEKKALCRSYATSIYNSYSKQRRNVTYIGCNMGKDTYIILETTNRKTEEEYIAKYEINEKREELILTDTTEGIETLRQKATEATMTEEEQQELMDKEQLEKEFEDFKTSVEDDQISYQEDSTYVRNYIEINIKQLKK